MFNEEIEQLNDHLRIIYIGKYFAKELYAKGIRIPRLFRGGAILDVLFHAVNKEKKSKKARKESQESIDTAHTCK